MKERERLLSKDKTLERIEQYFTLKEFIHGGAQCYRMRLHDSRYTHCIVCEHWQRGAPCKVQCADYSIVVEFKGNIPVILTPSDTIERPEFAKALMLLAMVLPFETAIVVDNDMSLLSTRTVATAWEHIGERTIYNALRRDEARDYLNETVLRVYIDHHVWHGDAS